MKKMTKKLAEEICYKADTEGLAYAAQNGYLDELGATAETAKLALNELEVRIEELKEKYGIETA